MFMYEVYMEWSVAEARARFSEVLHAAEDGPQYILSRGRRVAVIVDHQEYEALEALRATGAAGTLADALDDVRLVCADDGYELEVPRRRDRASSFGAGE